MGLKKVFSRNENATRIYSDLRKLPLGHTVQRGVARDTLDAVEGVEVLVQRDLEDGRSSLTEITI